MSQNPFQLVKDIFMNDIHFEYPEKALYENFIKLNADHWLKPSIAM